MHSTITLKQLKQNKTKDIFVYAINKQINQLGTYDNNNACIVSSCS